MGVFVNTFFEERVKQLFDLAETIDRAFAAAGIEYRVVGGLAAYLYVEAREPDAGRLTKDIDIVVRRADLSRIAEAVGPFGLELRHVAGVDMLVQRGAPSARRAVHLVFAGERVRPEYVEPAPELGGTQRLQGVPLVPVADLVKMKLTSFRLRDQMHLKDLDEAGLIVRDVEDALPDVLRERLRQVRERE